MGVVRTILLVAFIIICVLLVLMVLVQNEDSNGMGSAFGGGQSVAFGARSASVLTKTTAVFVALFFVVTFALALLTKAPSSKNDLSATAAEVEGTETVQETETENAGDWLEQEIGSSKEAESTVPSAEMTAGAE